MAAGRSRRGLTSRREDLRSVERDDACSPARAPQEAREDEQVVGVLGRVRGHRAGRLREARLHLESRARAGASVRAAAMRPAATKKARRRPGSRAGARTQSCGPPSRSSVAMRSTTSSRAPSRSRARAASSKRRSRASRRSLARSAGRASAGSSPLGSSSPRAASWRRRLLRNGAARPRHGHDGPAFSAPLEVGGPVWIGPGRWPAASARG